MSLPIALVTAAAARELDDDLAPLSAALDAINTDFSIIDWDDAVIDWSRFGLVVLRSTWDYTMRLDEFLAWAERVADLTTLLNPIDVIRWNTDKHYLAELGRAGVPVVPSFLSSRQTMCRKRLIAFSQRTPMPPSSSSSRASVRARAMRNAMLATTSPARSHMCSACATPIAACCCSRTFQMSMQTARPR